MKTKIAAIKRACDETLKYVQKHEAEPAFVYTAIINLAYFIELIAKDIQKEGNQKHILEGR